MKITANITDPSLVKELPDTSVLNPFLAEDLTADDVKGLFNNPLIRKKITYLFNYRLKPEVREKLINILMDAFKSQLDEKDIKIDEENDTIVAGDTVYEFKLFSIANSIFAIDAFKDIFFTQDIIDYVFDLDDEDFKDALIGVPSFWNELLSNDELYSYFKEKHGVYFIKAYRNKEAAFVKIALKEANVPVFDSYRAVNELIADASLVDLIKDNENAKKIYYDSIFGGFAEIGIATENTLNEDVSLDENVVTFAKAVVDKETYDAALNPYFVQKALEQTNTPTDFVSNILNDDVREGKLIIRHAGKDDDVTFTQEINTVDYHSAVISAALEGDIDGIIERTELLSNETLYDGFVDVIKPLLRLPFGKLLCKNNSDDSQVDVYFIENNILYHIPVKFSDNTSTTVDADKEIVTLNEGVNIVSVISALNGIVGVVTTAANPAVSTGVVNSSFIGFLNNRKLFFTDSVNNHTVAVTLDGYVLSNKFAIAKQIDANTLKEASISENALALKTDTQAIISGLIDGSSLQNVEKVVNDNFNDVDKIFATDKGIVVKLTNGDIKKATADGLIDYTDIDDYQLKDKDGNILESAKQNGIAKIVDRLGTLFVLDSTNALWYKDSDGNIQKIKDIADVEAVGEAIHVTPVEGDKYLFVLFNNKIRKYDYTNNL